MGWPKAKKKSYGHRAGVVPNLRVGCGLGNARTKGRPAVLNVSNSRSYSTEGTNHVANAIDSLALRCYEKPDMVVDRKLYKMLCSDKFLIIAYNQIKSRPGDITLGSPEPRREWGGNIENDGINNVFVFIQKLSHELRSETFTPGSGIKKGSPPSPRDKIVQEGIRIILNAIYEPTFLDSSHGFRPNRGCHTALEAIKVHFQDAS